MAITVKIRFPSGGSGPLVDYTEFVLLPESISGSSAQTTSGASQSSQAATLIKQWEVGNAPKATFFLGPDLDDVEGFFPPVTGCYVEIDCDTYGPIFSGYITAEPEIVPVGKSINTKIFAYVCACVGEEIILDFNRIGFIPPFANKTIGEIIAELGELLDPGRFDWTTVKTFGDVIPIYTTTPDQRFSQVVADLLKNQGAKMWFKRGVAFIDRFDEGNPAVEPTVDQTDDDEEITDFYNPYDLRISPIQSAVVNDVTGIGDTEAKVYAREYSVSDGATTNYRLKLPVFGATGKPVIQDDFSGDAFDGNIWAPFAVPNGSADPTEAFIFDNGRLNVVGGSGLNNTKLLAIQGIEIKGEVRIDAGEFQFANASDGIFGAAYVSSDMTLANCKYGFRFTKNGGQTDIQAIVDGALVGVAVTTKQNMTYSLHLSISTPTSKTTLPPWYSLRNAFGGGSKSDIVTVSFVVEEYSQLAVRTPQPYHIYQVEQTGVPAFLFVGELNVVDADFAVNYFQVTTPIQGALFSRLVSQEEGKRRHLGFVGQSDADATIVSTNEVETLEWFKETRPILRQRNELRYRSAGPAVARIIDQTSIDLEQLRYGDSGVRSEILTDIQPLPATSEELEWALQAYLEDHTRQRFEGAWAALVPPETQFAEEPIPGRFINVNCADRTPEIGNFSELVKVVTTTVRAQSDNGALEQFEHAFDYGPVVTRRMDKLLRQFDVPDPPEVAVLRQISNPTAVDTLDVATRFIDDLTSVALIDRDISLFYFDAGIDLADGDFVEVRYSDFSWGQTAGANFVGRYNTRLFSTPRKRRDSTFFFKLVRAA